MSILIRKMTEDEFEHFRRISVEDQAKELMEESPLSFEDALKAAEEEFSGMLPDGLLTADNHLMAVVEENTKEVVGSVWTLHEETEGRKQSFLCDFVIRESKRRRGYGAEALRLTEKYAAEAGCLESVLFVADRNAPAKALYQKCGYRSLRQEAYGEYLIKILL